MVLYTDHDFNGRPARRCPVHRPSLVNDVRERAHCFYSTSQQQQQQRQPQSMPLPRRLPNTWLAEAYLKTRLRCAAFTFLPFLRDGGRSFVAVIFYRSATAAGADFFVVRRRPSLACHCDVSDGVTNESTRSCGALFTSARVYVESASEQGLASHSTHNRSLRRRVLGANRLH